MAFALSRSEIDKLVEELQRLDKTGDEQLRQQCLKRTHAICDVLATGEQLEIQVVKLVKAGNPARAAKLLTVLAESGVMMRRLKFSKMF